MTVCSLLLLIVVFAGFPGGIAQAAGLTPVVDLEEDIYSYTPADNGAGPMWCHGSTCLVRIGDEVFASGLETLKDAKPLNNCRWMLFRRGSNGWEKVRVDEVGRTREPCPLAGFSDGRLFLSANPTLVPAGQAGGGPARPEILQFSVTNLKAAPEAILPQWQGKPAFSEHSYRSFAADGPGRELVLFQNIGYTHAEWAFLDRTGRWSAQGKLVWPWGADYAKPEPIRVCYPNVALKDRAVHFCGVSDILDPNPEWRAFKKQLTGRDWDYDFRRLFYTWTPDLTKERFRDWVEIASREKTCGWIMPCDLWIAPDGAVHLLWTERALDERLRSKFFPEARQSHALNYAVVRNGQVTQRRALALAEEGGSGQVPGQGRFQVTADGRLFVVFYLGGPGVSENRVLELQRDGTSGEAVRVPLKQPFTEFFSATPRAGSPLSSTVELLGHRAGSPLTVSYARIRLLP
jgi:hypothetical protein